MFLLHNWRSSLCWLVGPRTATQLTIPLDNDWRGSLVLELSCSQYQADVKELPLEIVSEGCYRDITMAGILLKFNFPSDWYQHDQQWNIGAGLHQTPTLGRWYRRLPVFSNRFCMEMVLLLAVNMCKTMHQANRAIHVTHMYVMYVG
jgi:hypothetical protein